MIDLNNLPLDENGNPIHPRIHLPRPPVDKDELWWTVKTLWGVEIPRVKVCPDHVAPFDAFAEGFFGNEANWALWYGSRGTGKSLMLALLALTKAAILEINVALLGGSMAQSQNVQEHIENLLLYPGAPTWAVAAQIQTQITFTGGNWIRPLPASQKTVRGPHPQMTCVAGWTLVNTLDGDIPIEEIQVGQRLWVSDDLATPRAGVVQRVLDQGWKETVNVHGDNGVITCTTDHRIHTQRGWVEAGELQPNDVLTVWQPSDWAQLQQDRTVSDVLADVWTRRETHLLLWEDAVTESSNVQGLLHGVEDNKCTEVSGLWLPVEADNHASVPVLPSGVDDYSGSAGEARSGASNGQRRDSHQSRGAGSGNAAYTSRYSVPDAGSARPMGDGLLVAEAQPVVGGSRVLLARPAEESSEGHLEASDAGVRGILDPVPTHGREGVLVGGIVHRVEPGPRCHVWDITTDAGNFYANGVLIHNCLDEIDEMDKKVYDAAMGQAMKKPNARGIEIDEMVVASSTWQNPVGTFQMVRDEALKKGLPVRTWCFREVLKTEENPSGWMDPSFIERKRKSVPAELFRVEYELGEPAGGSRAFDLAKLNEYFIHMDPVNERHAGSDDEWIFEEPREDAWYAVGADWAKEEDKTVIVVARVDTYPKQIVYLRRVNRKPWPEMAEMFNTTLNKYQAVAAHDGTGIGNVINDMIDERARKIVMVGRARSDMLVEYISAIERGEYRLPANTPAFDSHKATTVEEVYAPGKWNSHLADDVAAFAIMHDAASKQAPPAAMEGVRKTAYKPRGLHPIEPDWDPDAVQGEVRMLDGPDDNPFLVL